MYMCVSISLSLYIYIYIYIHTYTDALSDSRLVRHRRALLAVQSTVQSTLQSTLGNLYVSTVNVRKYRGEVIL